MSLTQPEDCSLLAPKSALRTLARRQLASVPTQLTPRETQASGLFFPTELKIRIFLRFILIFKCW